MNYVHYLMYGLAVINSSQFTGPGRLYHVNPNTRPGETPSLVEELGL